jgi:CDP-diacylglycerol---glycerol-3-phosphate 3-phosphatidyltransferase
MSLANIVSLLRVLALPIIIYLFNNEAFIPVLIVFSLAVFSDFLDGYLARKRREITKVGSFLDPFADRILIMGLLLFFVIRGDFHLIILALFILRDVIAGIIRWLSAQDDISLIGIKVYGRLVTYSQFFLIFGLLLSEFIFGDIIIFSFTLISILFVFLSIIHYSIVYLKAIHSRKKIGTRLEKENMIILANKKSRGFHDGYRRHLLRLFARRRKAKITYLPIRGDMFKEVGKKIKGKDHIIIAGGDGSFESALNNKKLHKKVLGFFPLGAGNAFYSYFYKGKRFEYLRSRFPFHEVELDIMELEWDKGKCETLFVNIGSDAEVIRLSSKRTQHGFRDYLKGTLMAIVKVRASYNLNYSIDGKKFIHNNTVSVTLAKVPYLGFAIRSLIGRVHPDDGLVYGLACVNSHQTFLNKLVRIWGLVLGMFNIAKAPLMPMRGKNILIKSDIPFPIQAGGEFLGYTKWIKINVKRKQKVLMI